MKVKLKNIGKRIFSADLETTGGKKAVSSIRNELVPNTGDIRKVITSYLVYENLTILPGETKEVEESVLENASVVSAIKLRWLRKLRS